MPGDSACPIHRSRLGFRTEGNKTEAAFKISLNLYFRTKWKRQTSLGLEMLSDTPRPTEPQLYTPAFGPQAALELYYHSQLRNLPLLTPLMLPNTQYSAYLAQLAARARSASSSSTSPPPTSSPLSAQGSTSPRREEKV